MLPWRFSGHPNPEHPHIRLPLDLCDKEHSPHVAWIGSYVDAECAVLAITFFVCENDSS